MDRFSYRAWWMLPVALGLCGEAFAQVEVYGIADAGAMGTHRGGTTSPSFQVMSGVMSTSRFGIRGTEDLGDGLKAIFNMEGQMNVDDGTGVANNGLNFARRSVVGLEGRLGQITVGREYTPGYYVAINNDTFRYGLWGSTIVFGATSGGLTTRASNSINYKSPNAGGFEGRLTYASGERDTAPARGGDLAGAAGYWASGPANVGVYFQQLQVAQTTGNNASLTRQYGIGAGWDGEWFRLNGGYAASNPAGLNNTLSMFYVGGALRAGAGEVLAQYLQQRQQNNQAKGSTIGLAYAYPLSKRTHLYATAGTTRNNGVATFALNNAANSLAPASAGQNVTAYGIGIRHRF